MNKQNNVAIISPFKLLVILLFSFTFSDANVLWYGDPERPWKDSFYNLNREPGEDGTVTTVQDPVHGNVWRINKPARSKRTEFARTTGEVNNYKINNGDRVFVGWRVKVNVAGSKKPNGGFAIFQLKTQGNLLQNHPVSIGFDAAKKNMNVQGITPGKNASESVSPRKVTFTNHPMNEDTWMDIVLGFKFAKTDKEGFVEVWINGKKQNVRNQNNQQQAPFRTHEEGLMYFKWGAYNETSRAFNITVDLDEMRVGTTLESVLDPLEGKTGTPQSSIFNHGGGISGNAFTITPQSGGFKVNAGKDPVRLEVIDLRGEVAYSRTGVFINSFVPIQSKGLYLLRFRQNRTEVTKKVMLGN